VSEIGFGTWGIGGQWGDVQDDLSLAALHAAADAGVTFFDTADVYGDGRSERLLGTFLRERKGERLFVATKIGKQVPVDIANYTRANFRAWVDQCRERLGTDMLDLVQLHCLPTDVYYHPELFEFLEELKSEGALAHYGVSIVRIEEGLKAIEYPGIATIQVVYNIFRQRPAERLLEAANACDVGVIARVPLASGLLAGSMRPDTEFSAADHRAFNRQGEAFDVGETFSGVEFETGLAAVERLRPLVPPDTPMSQFALRWILMNQAVTTAIPGAKRPDQARANAAASDLLPLPRATMEALAEIYRSDIAPMVHQRW
jgi:aryl-alcohol dehydrogenase-like predicted oxidoreductase